MTVRSASPADLPAIQRIQNASREAAHWPVADYLSHDCTVAEVEGQVAGYLVCRTVAAGEREILNMAVDPDFRRTGIARALLENACNRNPGDYFLEVRSSNKAAMSLYTVMGFTETHVRPEYYEEPPESGIVMKRSSCYRHSCQETDRGRQV